MPQTQRIDHLVDRLARRPGGWIGRLLYRHPVGHQSGFRRALAVCPVGPADTILDVGAGGGVFLDQALRSGCAAWGLDHSPDMIDEARRRNARAVATGRLRLTQGDAGALPFDDGVFSRVFCLHAFFFFPAPARALAEMARVTRPGGTVAVLTASPGVANWTRLLFAPLTTRMRFDPPEHLNAWGAAGGLTPDSLHPVATSGGLLWVGRKSTD